jgi:hypothetical protein
VIEQILPAGAAVSDAYDDPPGGWLYRKKQRQHSGR